MSQGFLLTAETAVTSEEELLTTEDTENTEFKQGERIKHGDKKNSVPSVFLVVSLPFFLRYLRG